MTSQISGLDRAREIVSVSSAASLSAGMITEMDSGEPGTTPNYPGRSFRASPASLELNAEPGFGVWNHGTCDIIR
jgi:hypothetical protein